MGDLIQHRSAAATAAFADGELRVGVDRLRLATLDGALDLPLGVQPVPPGGAGSDICVQAAGAAGWAPFTQGGGARPFDSQPWRVPGVTPLRFESVHLSFTTLSAAIELTQPMTIDRLAIKATSTGPVTFGVRDGVTLEVLASVTCTAGAGETTAPLTLTNGEPFVLQPGRYLTYCAADDLTIEVLVGLHSWSVGETRFPVFFSPVLA